MVINSCSLLPPQFIRGRRHNLHLWRTREELPSENYSEDSQSPVLLEGMYPCSVSDIFLSEISMKEKPRKGFFFSFLFTKAYCSVDKIISTIEQHIIFLQIVTQADLGLADAYINGDFSVVDKDKGLQNLFMVTQLTCFIYKQFHFHRFNLPEFCSADFYCQQRFWFFCFKVKQEEVSLYYCWLLLVLCKIFSYLSSTLVFSLGAGGHHCFSQLE